jgi:hypothetical protein
MMKTENVTRRRGGAERKPKTEAELFAQVNEWNTRQAEKTPVDVTLDDGTVKRTITSGKAFVLGGHSAVIFLEGISGCYALNRVTPAEDVAGGSPATTGGSPVPPGQKTSRQEAH